MTTPTPPLDSTPWNFIQWAISSLAAAILAVTGYIMRTNGKLNSHSSEISDHEELLDGLHEDMEQMKDKLSVRPTHEDISKLIFKLQDTLESQLNMINNRLLRIDERIDSIFRRDKDG